MKIIFYQRINLSEGNLIILKGHTTVTALYISNNFNHRLSNILSSSTRWQLNSSFAKTYQGIHVSEDQANFDTSSMLPNTVLHLGLELAMYFIYQPMKQKYHLPLFQNKYPLFLFQKVPELVPLLNIYPFWNVKKELWPQVIPDLQPNYM